MLSRFTASLGATLLLGASALSATVPGVDLALMDRTVLPAVDFYRYANGAFDKQPIPPERTYCGVNLEIDNRNRAILKDILEACAKDEAAPEGTPAQRIRDFYRSGLDEAAIDKAGLAPLADLLEALGQVKTPAALAAAMGRLHTVGISAGFAFAVDQDQKSSRAHLPILFQGGLGLPERDFYFRQDPTSRNQRAAYVKHIARMFELAGDKAGPARAAAAQVLALETRLAKVSRKLVDLRDPEANYHKLDRQALAKVAPAFPWGPFFEALGLPATERCVDLGQPEFFRGLGVLVRATPMAHWRAYLKFHALSSMADYLGKDFENEDFAFYGRKLTGQQVMRARWERVLGVMDAGIGEDLGQLYVKRAFSPEAKAKVQSMVKFHLEALGASIKRASWMSEATQKQALQKLASLHAKVGYPDTWRDYAAMGLKPQPYILNVLAAKTFEFKRSLAKLGRPVALGEWTMSPQTNNAYYNPSLNEIVLPAGILQPPFYDEFADDASNYGLLSSTIGHELLHGFDDQGSLYDADGNLKNWWTPADRKAYEAQTQAVVRQYDAYEPFPGMHLQGKQTLGENLADIGGLKIAFEAWKLASAGTPQVEVAGLTAEQRFFVGFAQSWRTNMRPEMERYIVQSDVHCPARWRVLGSVSALPVFQTVFGAPDPHRKTTDAQFTLW
jgi:putative endopeptidase